MTEDQQAEIIIDALHALTPVVGKLTIMTRNPDDFIEFLVNLVCTLVSGGAEPERRNECRAGFIVEFCDHVRNHIDQGDDQGSHNGAH